MIAGRLGCLLFAGWLAQASCMFSSGYSMPYAKALQVLSLRQLVFPDVFQSLDVAAHSQNRFTSQLHTPACRPPVPTAADRPADRPLSPTRIQEG